MNPKAPFKHYAVQVITAEGREAELWVQAHQVHVEAGYLYFKFDDGHGEMHTQMVLAPSAWRGFWLLNEQMIPVGLVNIKTEPSPIPNAPSFQQPVAQPTPNHQSVSLPQEIPKEKVNAPQSMPSADVFEEVAAKTVFDSQASESEENSPHFSVDTSDENPNTNELEPSSDDLKKEPVRAYTLPEQVVLYLSSHPFLGTAPLAAILGTTTQQLLPCLMQLLQEQKLSLQQLALPDVQKLLNANIALIVQSRSKFKNLAEFSDFLAQQLQNEDIDMLQLRIWNALNVQQKRSSTVD